MSEQTMMEVFVADAELLEPAILDAYEMCSMNFARLEHQRLNRLIRSIVIPMIGGYQTELGEALDRHLEQVIRYSGNFCWKHRHLGASYGDVSSRPGADD